MCFYISFTFPTGNNNNVYNVNTSFYYHYYCYYSTNNPKNVDSGFIHKPNINIKSHLFFFFLFLQMILQS